VGPVYAKRYRSLNTGSCSVISVSRFYNTPKKVISSFYAIILIIHTLISLEIVVLDTYIQISLSKWSKALFGVVSLVPMIA
jgi:succinate dehydrogenase hydrophobic anchor subunit